MGLYCGFRNLTAVVVGGLEFVPGLPNLKVIRTLRVVRPLRSIKALPSMRRLVTSLLNSLPALANVVVFLLFVFVLFGIFGIQIFQGNFYSICRLTPIPDPETGHWPINFEVTNLCSVDSDCPAGNFCGSSEAINHPLYLDTDIQEYALINYGITNFDNIFTATLTIFQIITLEGWTQLMYDLSDSGQPVVSPLYFCLLVVIGSFFLLNLNLAVIMNEFTKVDDKFKAEIQLLKQQKFQQQDDDSSIEDVEEEEDEDQDPDGDIRQQKNSKININSKSKDNQNQWELKNSSSDSSSSIQNQNNNIGRSKSSNQNQSNSLIVKNSTMRDRMTTLNVRVDQDFEQRGSYRREDSEESFKMHKKKTMPVRLSPVSPQLLGQGLKDLSKVRDFMRSQTQKRHSAAKPIMARLSIAKDQPIFESSQLDPGSAGIKKRKRHSRKIKRLNQSEIRVPSSRNVGRIFNHHDKSSDIMLENTQRDDQLRVHSDSEQANKNSSDIGLAKIDEASFDDNKILNLKSIENIEHNQSSNSVEKSLQDLEKHIQDTEARTMDILIERSHKNFIYRTFYLICTHFLFSILILLLILANTIVLALDRYPIQKNEFQYLETINDILSICFSGEMLIKLIGLGPKGYASDKFNNFDCLIVVISISELILQEAELGKGITSSGAISAFRAIRLLRIFKLARSWKSFQDILIKIGKTFKDISNFIVLLFLFIFTYAMLGMELFAYKVRYDSEGNPINLDQYGGMSTSVGKSPRENFDSFLNAFVTIFIVLIGDGWNTIMYNFARALGTSTVLFFIVLVILGKMILMNLFLAILLRNFGDQESAQENIEEKLLEKFKRYLGLIKKKLLSTKCMRRKSKLSEFERTEKDLNSQENDNGNPGLTSMFQSQTIQKSHMDFLKSTHNDKKLGRRQISQENNSQGSQPDDNNQRKKIVNNIDEFELPNRNEDDDDNHQDSKRILIQGKKESDMEQQGPSQQNTIDLNLVYQQKAKQLGLLRKRKSIYVSEIGHSNKLYRIQKKKNYSWIYPYSLERKSIFIFSHRNMFRNLCAKIINHKLFDPFILLIITTSTVTLALDNPLNDPKGTMTTVLQIIDQLFTAIFLLECALKIISYGFILNGPQSYLINPWNDLDFIILGFSLVSVVPNDKIDFKFMKAIRMLRVVRPLRVISRNQGLRIAVLSLLNSILGIFHVFTITILFFLLFGIFGINYFKGTFYRCYQDQIPDTNLLIYNKWDCLNLGGEWINLDSNFDNILTGIKTLFEMSSTEGWTDVMWAGVDASDIDSQPIESNNQMWVLFFMAFLLFGSLFIMNLFVGVVINTFNEEREKLGKNHLLTTFQKEWIMIQITLLKLKPQVKKERIYKSKIRNFISMVSYSQKFEFLILIAIILNTICFAIEWYNQPQEVNNILEIINYAFATIFTIETIIKFIAQGYQEYFTNGWNVFDLMIVIGTITSVFLTVFTSTTFGASTTLIRTFRIGRVLRIVSKASFLKKIFNTFVVTMPSLANIGGLLALLLYIFSILGIFLFADVKLQNNLEQHANFQNFYLAFLTLIRCATGESWNNIMNDCARTRTIIFECKTDPSYQDYVNNGYVTLGCGDPTQAYAFFMSFTMLVSMIFLNLFIAIILESFENVNQQEDLKIKENDLDLFQKAWLLYDPKGTGFIEIDRFETFLLDLVEQKSQFIREGEQLKQDSLARRHFIEELELPTYQRMSTYHYADVLHTLSKAALQIDLIQGNYYMTEGDDVKSQTSKNTSQKKDFNQLSTNVIIDQEIIKIATLNETQKIQLVEEFSRLSIKSDENKRRYLDQFEGNIYNSRFVFLLISMKARIRFWVAKRRKQRQIEEQLRRNITEKLTKNPLMLTIDPKPYQQTTENNINSPQFDISHRLDGDSEEVIEEQSQGKNKSLYGDDQVIEEDPESIEILNGSRNEDSLRDAKTKLKISRQKRQQEIKFTQKINSVNASTFDTDLNSLIKQLSGNQESLTSANMSGRESEMSETPQEIVFRRKSEVSVKQGFLDKGWFKQLPNSLNTIISEMRQEESFSTSRILQKSVDEQTSRNIQSESPIESQKASQKNSQLQNFFAENLLNNKQSLKQENSENVALQISQERSQDNNLVIQYQNSNPVISINCMTILHRNYIDLTEENQDDRSQFKNHLQQQQQLTVSFGLSDYQAEDFSDVRIFSFQENFKSSEKSQEQPKVEEDSQTHLNQHKDSPKFVSSKIQNFKFDSNRITNHRNIRNSSNAINLRKKLTKLIKTKEEIKRQETVKNKIQELIKKPDSMTIRPQNTQSNKQKQDSHQDQLPMDNEDLIVVGSIYTDQTDSRQDLDSSSSFSQSSANL